MARYFFHVHNGKDFIDREGTELPTVELARNEAVRLCGALLGDQPEIFWSSGEWTMRVADVEDLTLFQLTFFATDGAVTTH